MKSKRNKVVLLLTAMATVLSIGIEAHAIIGRPLTPMSYAGVARRSVRRGAYYGAAYGAAGYYGAAAAGAAMTALPPGCAPGLPCGGAVYHPAYYGGSVVYVP